MLTEPRFGRYDCHVEMSHRTRIRDLEQFLRDADRDGAVLVQAHEDCASRRSMLESLGRIGPTRAVARIEGNMLHEEFVAMNRAGVCGARLDLLDNGRWGMYEQVGAAHDRMPGHWHLELGLSFALAAKLAPLLARVGRVFSLSLGVVGGSPSEQDEATLRWWLEMGNVYVKVLQSPFKQPIHGSLMRLAVSTPERIVLGSGWPGMGLPPQSPKSMEGLLDLADRNAECLYQFNTHPH